MPNTRYFFLLVSQTVPAQPIFSSNTWHTASGLEDNKRSGNQTPTTTKMAAGKTSIAEELLQMISLHQMRAIPAYLSESDATTIEAFAKSELSLTYVLDTQNLYWPGSVNRSDVFDPSMCVCCLTIAISMRPVTSQRHPVWLACALCLIYTPSIQMSLLTSCPFPIRFWQLFLYWASWHDQRQFFLWFISSCFHYNKFSLNEG